MTKSTLNTAIINNLINIAEDMFLNNIPSHVWVDNGITGFVNERPDYHWSATKDEAEAALGRQMTKEEITLLSLGRCFGPTPALESALAKEVMAFLWPDGTSYGNGLDWAELRNELYSYAWTKKATKKVVDQEAYVKAHSIVNHGTNPAYEPYMAINSVARVYLRAGRVDLAVHFAKTLYKELRKQTIEMAYNMQSPAWGHLKQIFEDGTIIKRDAVFKLWRDGILPTGNLYGAASATVEAEVNYKNFCSERGVIEHLQYL